jgi:hypothetical protein
MTKTLFDDFVSKKYHFNTVVSFYNFHQYSKKDVNDKNTFRRFKLK